MVYRKKAYSTSQKEADEVITKDLIEYYSNVAKGDGGNASDRKSKLAKSSRGRAVNLKGFEGLESTTLVNEVISLGEDELIVFE